MTKPNSTEVVFIVDRSGSMRSIAEAMSSGFDEFVHKQKTLPGECKVTAVQFDTEYEVLYTAVPLDQVPPYKLEPRGGTALHDAIGQTILAVGSRLGAMPEHERPSKVLFVIITDGGENASKEFTRERVFSMITHQREKYSWEFIYLGANQDAIAVGTSLGVQPANARTYEATQEGTAAVMDWCESSVRGYRGA